MSSQIYHKGSASFKVAVDTKDKEVKQKVPGQWGCSYGCARDMVCLSEPTQQKPSGKMIVNGCYLRPATQSSD